MSQDHLSKSYFEKQASRVHQSTIKINARDPLAAGRVIPGADDLSIHDGRRIDATVMFLDISSFTDRPSWDLPEQEMLLRSLSLFFTEMVRIIEDFGGNVEKNTGDGLMAYFTHEPLAVISVQQRALSAALTMFYAADNLINPTLERSGIAPFKFRICLDHGPITIARVGAAKGFNGIVAIGTTANIASKMLGVAPAGTILLGDFMIRKLPDSWRTTFGEIESESTGFVHTPTNEPYKFWRYTGRWKVPTV